MKTMRKKNEGAALVSVLIGVLFISILASSLLYMATVNFQMKKMRYTSTDNFYTAEFAVEELLSQIQQKAQVPDTDTSGLTIYKELHQLFAPAQDGNGYWYYNEENLRNLINIDGRKYGETGAPAGTPIIEGIEGIKVTNIYRNPDTLDSPQADHGAYTRSVYEEDDKSIKIYGLKITVTTDEAHGSYESSVTLDLEYAFPEYKTSGYSYGTPFGVLSDTPYKINSGNHVFTGPIYMAHNDSAVDGIEYSLYVGKESVVTLLTRSFFEGDVYVDQGTLMISDDTYINGDLIVKAPGSVYITGNLYVRHGITAPSGAVKTSDHGSVTENTPTSKVDWDFIDTEYSGHLAKCIAANTIHFFVDETDGTVAGFGGVKHDLEVSKEQFQGMEYLGQDTGKKIISEGTVDGLYVKAVYLRSTTTNGAGTDLNNSLIISHGEFQVQTPLINSTFINISDDPNHHIEFESGLKAKTNIWGAMNRESFDAAQKLFFHCDIPKLNNTYPVQWASSGDLTMIKNTSTTDTAVWKFNDTEEVVQYAADGNRLYYRTKDGSTKTTYMPFGNLLSPKYGETVDKFWGACYLDTSSGTGSGSGDKAGTPTLLITHWTKQ